MRLDSKTARLKQWTLALTLTLGLSVLAAAAWVTSPDWLRAFHAGASPDEPMSLHVTAVLVLTISYFILAGTFVSLYRKCKGLLGFRAIFLIFALFTSAAGAARILGLLTLAHRQFRFMPQLEMALATLAVVSAGIVAGLVGSVREFLVTVRQSQRNEARFIAASESSLEAFYTLEAVRGRDGQIVDFEFTYVNSNGEKLVGLPREQILGQHLCALIPINRSGGFFDEYKHVVMTGQPAVQEFPMQVEGDGQRWIRHEVVRLEDGIAITAADITERKLYERAAEHRAQHDPLTGLPNRSLLHDRMQQAIDRAVRYRHKVALFVIDMDHFKEINDTLGHAAGDTVLMTVAQRLRESVRGSDSVLRIGGDEFIVVVPDVQEERDIRRLAAKMNAAIARDSPEGLDSVNMSCSIGIAIYPSQAATSEELFSRADAAMYEAKRSGGGCFEVYSEATPEFTTIGLTTQATPEPALRNLPGRPSLIGEGSPKSTITLPDA